MDFILKEFKYNQNKRNKRNKSLNYHSKERNMSTCPLVRLSAAADRPLRPARLPAEGRPRWAIARRKSAPADEKGAQRR
jgi:hypothetical protein